MKITIFTPVYNRATHIIKLYESLKKQTYKNFEWVIVNDGSTDNINEVVASLIEDNEIDIKYFSQENSGKHIAINNGAKNATGVLFFTVDSDDLLTPEALNRVMYHWNNIQKLPADERAQIIGVSGHRMYPNGSIIGGNVDYDVIDVDLLKFRFVMGIKGDKAEIYLTQVVKENPFPKIENENYCPEALIFYRLAQKGFKLRQFNESIYIGEYLDDGLTKNGFKMIKKNPIGILQYYAEMTTFSNVPVSIRIKYCILFWRFSFYDKRGLMKKLNLTNWIWSWMFIPIGFLYYLKDKNK